jgi:hypothetical protein
MDGRFARNITIGPVVVEAVRRCTQKSLSVHLMIVEPERYLTGFAKAGADRLLVQAAPSATIHRHRKKAGMVLDPATPTELIGYDLHLCDRQSRLRRPEILTGDAAQDPPVVAALPRARSQSGHRGRRRTEL